MFENVCLSESFFLFSFSFVFCRHNKMMFITNLSSDVMLADDELYVQPAACLERSE